MSRLKKEEIAYIEKVYEEVRSIKKTEEITGFSNSAVIRYTKHMSSLNPRSRNCPNPIYQINLEDNSIIKEWVKPSIAAKELCINPAEICRVAKGELRQAGGFGWKYKFDK